MRDYGELVAAMRKARDGLWQPQEKLVSDYGELMRARGCHEATSSRVVGVNKVFKVGTTMCREVGPHRVL